MGIGFASITPYTIRKVIPPTIYASTVADSSTFTGALHGENYIVSIQCTTGALAYNPCGVVCTTANSPIIMAGDTHTFMVKKNGINPNSVVSLFGLSTTTQYQAWIFE